MDEVGEVGVAPFGVVRVAEAGVTERVTRGGIVFSDPPVAGTGEVVQPDRLVADRTGSVPYSPGIRAEHLGGGEKSWPRTVRCRSTGLPVIAAVQGGHDVPPAASPKSGCLAGAFEYSLRCPTLRGVDLRPAPGLLSCHRPVTRSSPGSDCLGICQYVSARYALCVRPADPFAGWVRPRPSSSTAPAGSAARARCVRRLANSRSSPGYLPATADVAADLLTVAAGAGLARPVGELVACPAVG